MKAPLRVIAVFALASIPRPASAEVSDKVSSIPEHWMFAGVLATLVFLAVRWRWWLAIPLILPLAFVISAEWESPGDLIGAAILEEQGWPYFVSLWCSYLFMASGLAIGTFFGWRRRSRKDAPPTPPLQQT